MGLFKILYLKEDITLKNAHELKRKITRLVNGNSTYIILNMEKVGYINGLGLEIIIQSSIIARKKNKEIVITNIGSSLRESFHTTKLSTFIKWFDSDREAIAYCQQNNS
ncbi:anti-anti-sigma factor [Thermolongibacillus altinsuensis]|uniref:Anti-anti-sigma factor n=1 Tax=Thermolongibacillus altinsuensis TaxID=575256 RepID=A0A4R1QBR7_9BACL|nr:STAS domain-containing protein [Thermolongibacillus altinsuensis]TCL46779.1 anti-anti-sigma factor [Thermolongibacillus altinsuensis]GMB09287.1 hypothetical protein B1no1_19970 [Thermolongibacillus altinsuensis]